MRNQTSKEDKLRILINSFEDFSLLSNHDNVIIDKRNFLIEGDIEYAGPISEYDLVVLDLVNPAENISSNRIKQLKTHINNGKPFIFILRKFNANSPYSNYHQLLAIFGNIFSFNIKEMGSKYELTSFGKSSIFKDYLMPLKTDYEISIVNDNKIESLADNTEGNSVAFKIRGFKNCLSYNRS